MADLTPAQAEALAAAHRAALLDVIDAQTLAGKYAAKVADKRKTWLAARGEIDHALGLGSGAAPWSHTVWLLILTVVLLWHHPIAIPAFPVIGTVPSTPTVDTTPYHAVLIDDPTDFAQSKATAPFRIDPGAAAALKAVNTTWAHLSAANPALAEHGYQFTASELPLLVIVKDGVKTPIYRGPPPKDVAALTAQIQALRGKS